MSAAWPSTCSWAISTPEALTLHHLIQMPRRDATASEPIGPHGYLSIARRDSSALSMCQVASGSPPVVNRPGQSSDLSDIPVTSNNLYVSHLICPDICHPLKMATPPPLPPDLIEHILEDYLLPLQSSLIPANLLSSTLAHRITYISPDPTDHESHLSPYPPQPHPQAPLASSHLAHLHSAARGASSIQYATDGEHPLARVIVSDLASGSESDAEAPSVEVLMLFEMGAEDIATTLDDGPVEPVQQVDAAGGAGKGSWKFHAALPHPSPHTSSLSWLDTPVAPPIQPDESPSDHIDLGSTAAPHDYWGPPSPPSSSTTPPSILHHADDEDAYWASYGPSTPYGGTPQMSRQPSAHAVPHAKSNGHLPTSAAAPPISADTQSNGSQGESTEWMVKRLDQRIGGVLRKLWLEFSGGESEDSLGPDVLEERALAWLRLTREWTTTNPHANGHRPASPEEPGDGLAVLKGKVQVLQEVYSEVGDDFWRLVEGAIRMQPEVEVDAEEAQRLYWE